MVETDVARQGAPRQVGRPAGVAAAVAVGVGAAGFAALAVLGTMPSGWRWFAWAMAGLLAVVAAGMWWATPWAIAIGLVLGGLLAFAGLWTLLGVGDDVYEHLPDRRDVYVPFAIAVLGGAAVACSTALVPPSGRPGRWVAVAALVVGVALTAVGVRWLLEVHEVRSTTSGVSVGETCGSAYEPGIVYGPAYNRCFEEVRDARNDGRLAVAVGGVLVLVGVGSVVGQFGWRRCWPFVLLGGGALLLGVAAWFLVLPLWGGGCPSLLDGPDAGSATRPLGAVDCGVISGALGAVTTGLAVVGGAAMAAGAVGVVLHGLRIRRETSGGPGTRAGPSPQVSA